MVHNTDRCIGISNSGLSLSDHNLPLSCLSISLLITAFFVFQTQVCFSSGRSVSVLCSDLACGAYFLSNKVGINCSINISRMYNFISSPEPNICPSSVFGIKILSFIFCIKFSLGISTFHLVLEIL